MTQTSTMTQKRDQLPQAAPPEQVWLNPHEAAQIIGVTPNYIREACHTGSLKHTRLMGKRAIRINRADLENWMQSHTEPPQA